MLRLGSIDVFRALTMFLMIFVNDLWTLKDIPGWLLHTKAQEDGMGLSDVVFPAFLFIVGLSIPFAIQARLAKGANAGQTVIYILTRSFALLVIGFFHVNLENYNETQALLPKAVWQILITIAFFLVWLDYSPKMKRSQRIGLQVTGVLLLVAMAVIYVGSINDNAVWMRPQWWGILGLIGWAYLLSALTYLFIRDKVWLTLIVLIFFSLFNIATHAGWLGFLDPVRTYVWIIGDGSMPALAMAGVFISVLYRKYRSRGFGNLAFLFSLIGLIMLVGGFLLRPYWGISKILSTPSWVMICTGISIFFFLLLVYLVDIRKKESWFRIIKPAGTSTLTAYLLPYIHYALYTLIGFSLPIVLRTGLIGIVKSLLYALIIILITGWLERRRIRLKI